MLRTIYHRKKTNFSSKFPRDKITLVLDHMIICFCLEYVCDSKMHFSQLQNFHENSPKIAQGISVQKLHFKSNLKIRLELKVVHLEHYYSLLMVKQFRWNILGDF